MSKKPIIMVVDDDPNVLKAITRDIKTKYRKEYRVLSTDDAQEALDTAKELKKKGEEIALFVSDQRMPVMLGVEFLEQVIQYYPKAKRVLLTAYSDTDAAIKAINDVQLDFYLMKPWNPPEEKLYPVLDDLLIDWQGNYRPAFSGIKLVGFPFSLKSHELKDFLSGNLIPYRWLDVLKDKEADDLKALHGFKDEDLPVVIYEDGTMQAYESNEQIAERIGLNPKAKAEIYDVVIIGAGPAGLAAAVYGGSEGLNSLLIERRAPGGQAGTSSRIENYLGFPTGISGSDLSRRAITQAQRFGVEFLSPKEVKSIAVKDGYKHIELNGGDKILSKAIVISTGVDYRKLESGRIPEFTGKGVYYGAATTEATTCADRQVYIVGGGNSAGQGAMYLSQFANKVHIVIRRADLSDTMSSYLIDQINATPNIEVLPFTEIIDAGGEDHLEEVTVRDNQTKSDKCSKCDALFIFIGAKPYTDWLGEDLVKDQRGFLLTGQDVMNLTDYKQRWKLDRDPYLLETVIPGVFAAGDVRSGAMNRVASAVGEGAMSISMVHRYIGDN